MPITDLPRLGRSRTISAYNSARHSENIIHSDAYAIAQGFRGGLVPGSDTCGYLSHLAVAEWGDAWLSGGQATFRLISPIYEGDQAIAEITVVDEAGFSAQLMVNGTCCASATCTPTHVLELSQLPVIERKSLPGTALPAATPESLAVGVVLPEIVRAITDEQAQSILVELREDLPVYQQHALVHPGYLLRLANWALSNTVRLGPWVHVGSQLFNFRPCPAGESLSACSQVTHNFEKKGHRFVTLDVRIHAGSIGVVSRVLHTAIYQLRSD